MKFKNTKNGAVIDVTVPISGGDWVPFEELKTPEVEETKEVEEEVIEQEEPKEETFDLTAMTVEQLKAYAKENEITIPTKATKAQILGLIAEAFQG